MFLAKLLLSGEHHPRACGEVASVAGERHRADEEGGEGGNCPVAAFGNNESVASGAGAENGVEICCMELWDALSYFVSGLLYSTHLLFP